jgi:ribosomal-protein-serine acetyltransferase
MLSHRIDDETELRLIEPHHAEALNALIEGNLEHIREWSGWLRRDRSIQNTHDFIKRNLARMAEDDGYALGIWHGGEMAGQIEYNYIDRANRKTDIGYWLGARFQGRGIVTKSCRALIDYAFGGLGLNRVEMHCAAENRRSRAIPERLGFRQEGVLVQAEWMHDHFHDLVVYAMLAGEWGAGRGAPAGKG